MWWVFLGAINIKQVLENCIIDGSGTNVFGVDCNTMDGENTEYRNYSRTVVALTQMMRIKVLVSLALPKIWKVLKLSIFDMEAMRYFQEVASTTAKFRQSNNIEKKDVMQMMMKICKKKDSDEVDTRELMNQLLGFFAAGTATTYSTLTFLFHEMVFNPDIQENLRREIHDVLDKYEGRITNETLNEMEYTERCINGKR